MLQYQIEGFWGFMSRKEYREAFDVVADSLADPREVWQGFVLYCTV